MKLSTPNTQWNRLLLLVSTLLLLGSLAASAEEAPRLLSGYKFSDQDRTHLTQTLEGAVASVAPYRSKAMPQSASLPSEVPTFFSTAQQLAKKYNVKGGDLLEIPQAFLVKSGRVTQQEAQQAFQPLTDLLNSHNVRGDEILELIVPNMLNKMELALKTPPDERKNLRGSGKNAANRNKAIAFARKHDLSLMELASALKSLRGLQKN